LQRQWAYLRLFRLLLRITFANKVEKLESHYINFMEEFANILHRQAATQIEAKANVSA